MFYDFSVTVPANTLDSAPVSQQLKLTEGVVQKVSILFPPGPHGMVKVRIMSDGHQLLPTNPEGYFASDNEIINIDEWYPLGAGSNVLRIIASSPGTSYDHTISGRFGVLRPEEIEAQSGLMSGIKKFLALVGIGR